MTPPVLSGAVAGEHEAYELRAIALTQLVYIVGVLGRFHEARELAADAQAVLDVLGAPPLLHAQLQSNLGVAARHAGRLEDAWVERALLLVALVMVCSPPCRLRSDAPPTRI